MPVRVIEPRRVGLGERFREFWKYRRTLRFFGRRLIEKSYLRTVLGWLWIPLRPVLEVGTQILVFGFILKAPSNGIPYPVFFIVGQTSWRFFSSSLYWMTRSIELNRRYLRHLYIPRLTLLTSALAPSTLNLILYGVIGILVIAYYAITQGTLYLTFGPETLLAGAGFALTIGIAASVGFFTSVYGAQARDVRFALSYLLGFWALVTPVIYPLSAVPKGFQGVASINPMTAPMEMIRKGIIGTGDVTAIGVASALLFIVILGGFGLRFFNRAEAAALDRL